MTDTPTENQSDLLVNDPLPPAPLATMPVHPLMETINKAIESGRTGAELKEILDLAERMEAKLAKRAYDEAFAAFQAECPAVVKGREADFVTKGGARVHYWYSPLDAIDDVVLPVLNKHDFTRTFGNATLDESGRILTVTCILSHIGGHREERSFSVPTETSAGMSPQQKFGNADTYAKRRAFMNVGGIKGCEVDNDAGDDDEPVETITSKQANELNDLLLAAFPEDNEADNAKRKAWRDKLLTATGLHPETHTLADFPADKFEEYAGKIQHFVDELRKDGT